MRPYEVAHHGLSFSIHCFIPPHAFSLLLTCQSWVAIIAFLVRIFTPAAFMVGAGTILKPWCCIRSCFCSESAKRGILDWRIKRLQVWKGTINVIIQYLGKRDILCQIPVSTALRRDSIQKWIFRPVFWTLFFLSMKNSLPASRNLLQSERKSWPNLTGEIFQITLARRKQPLRIGESIFPTGARIRETR